MSLATFIYVMTCYLHLDYNWRKCRTLKYYFFTEYVHTDKKVLVEITWITSIPEHSYTVFNKWVLSLSFFCIFIYSSSCKLQYIFVSLTTTNNIRILKHSEHELFYKRRHSYCAMQVVAQSQVQSWLPRLRRSTRGILIFYWLFKVSLTCDSNQVISHRLPFELDNINKLICCRDCARICAQQKNADTF
jgi:hypothetical protein